MSKRILSLVLALVMVLGTFGTLVFAEEATENAKVNKLIELGLVQGYPDGTYGLDKEITRAEVATMVVRALDKEAEATAMLGVPSIFSDMLANWANGYVNYAVGKGIVNGYPDGTFKPGNNITYSEVAAMLVRVRGGLTATEEANAIWPTTYLTRAAELGILAGVTDVNFAGVAVREKVFEMVYNTAMSTDLFLGNVVEGLVVENYRTEGLGVDEVVVHVMFDQVTRDGKEYKNGQEFKVKLPEGFDAEALLGKVVKVSYDKAGKVVGIEVNNSYDYIQGPVNDLTMKAIKVDGVWYTLGKDESVKSEDDRLYQVYHNNEDVKLAKLFNLAWVAEENANDGDTLYETVNLDYAKLTIVNGKVLFVDAFAFDDVAPVAKDIDSKDRVAYYDDVTNVAIKNLIVDKYAYVINFVDGEFTVGNYEDIAAGDVIHFYNQDNKAETLTVIVRPYDDNSVEGEYEKVKASKAKDAGNIQIVVDGEDYPALVQEPSKTPVKDYNREAVYSVNALEEEFAEITGEYDTELKDFKKLEVVLLRDMFGYVQLISSESVDGSFYALVSNTGRDQGEIKLVRADNSDEWYSTSARSTKFSYPLPANVDDTQDKLFNAFSRYDLVKATAVDEDLTKLEYVENTLRDDTVKEQVAHPIYKLTKDYIQFAEGGDIVAISGRAVVFTAFTGKAPKAMTLTAFLKAYEGAFTGFAATNKKGLVDAIVITIAGDKDDTKPTTDIVKISGVSTSGAKEIRGTNADGPVEYDVSSTATGWPIPAATGKIVKLTLKGEVVTNIEEITLTEYTVEDITYDSDNVTVKYIKIGGQQILVSTDAVIFGSFAKGDTVKAVASEVTAKYIVTVINK